MLPVAGQSAALTQNGQTAQPCLPMSAHDVKLVVQFAGNLGLFAGLYKTWGKARKSWGSPALVSGRSPKRLLTRTGDFFVAVPSPIQFICSTEVTRYAESHDRLLYNTLCALVPLPPANVPTDLAHNLYISLLASEAMPSSQKGDNIGADDDFSKPDTKHVDEARSNSVGDQVVAAPESLRDMTENDLKTLERKMVRKVDLVIL